MNEYDIRVRVVKDCQGISPWIHSMEQYVNDGRIYHALGLHGGSYRVYELGLYFPPESLQILDTIDLLISSDLIKTNWTRKKGTNYE